MTIKTIRVVSKYIRTCERFKEFLMDNIDYVEGGELSEYDFDPVIFAVSNARKLNMFIRREGSRDKLSLYIYSGTDTFIAVRYLEAYDTEDGSGFNAHGTEIFERPQIAKAIESFMTRWLSDTPENFPFTPDDEQPQTTEIVPIDCTMTPAWIRENLALRQMVKVASGKCQGVMAQPIVK